MKVNGQEIKLEKPVVLEAFLNEYGYYPKKVAVEKNGEIVPKRAFETEVLSDADKIEIVCFVGGG